MAVLSPWVSLLARWARSGCRLGALLAGTVLLLAATPAQAAQPSVTSREYQVKAVFLFNFAQFVEWPTTAFPAPDSPLIIGVLGTDPFGATLDGVVKGESVGGRPLLARRFHRVEEIDRCHVLFISESEAPRIAEITAALMGRSILTVGDGEGFARRGIMIRFFPDRNRVRLRINLDAARTAGLTISSKLLRPAEIVSDKEAVP